jgi:DNA repair protein RadC
MKRKTTSYTPPLFASMPLVGLQVLRDAEVPYADATCENPDRIAAYWRDVIMKDPRHRNDVESVYAFHMNARRRVTGYALVSQGTLDTILVHAREVFRTAIVSSAHAVVIAHNHPSGDPTPSEADVKVTRDLIRAGQLLKIDLLDHVVIANQPSTNPKGYASLRELGYFYS